MKAILVLTALALIMTVACSTGDAATPCTSPDVSAAPTVSPLGTVPEGKLLMMPQTGGNVYTLDEECGMSAVTRGNSVATAPDGSATVVTLTTGNYSTVALSYYTTGLAVLSADGLTTVAEWPKRSNDGPAVVWSRDSMAFAYTKAPSTKEPRGVWVWDGHESRRVFTGDDSWPIGWTSDGDVVISAGLKDVRVIDKAGDVQQTLTAPFSEWSMGYWISPDGTKLVVESTAESTATMSMHSTGLWLYDFGTKEWQQLSQFDAEVSASPGAGLFVSADAALEASMRKGAPPPEWSPDSTRFAYYREYTDAGQVLHNDLWLYDLRSGEDRLLSDKTTYAHGWSPDGRYLALQTGGPETVALLGPDGKVRDLTDLGERYDYAGYTSWAPDGRLVVSGGDSLKLYDPDGGDVQALTLNGDTVLGSGVYAGDVYWSPSGRYFSFSVSPTSGSFNPVTGKPGVYVADTESGAITRITQGASLSVYGWLGE